MKKGLTPLLATVILLAFAIALGGVVISWGKASYTPLEKGCEGVSISLVTLQGKPLICTQGANVQFTLQNDGQTALDHLTLSFLFERGLRASTLERSIPVAEIVKSSAPLPNNLGKMEKVIFSPGFSGRSGKNLCPKRGFAVEDIEVC